MLEEMFQWSASKFAIYFGNVEIDLGDLLGEKQINLTVFEFSYFINLANFEAFFLEHFMKHKPLISEVKPNHVHVCMEKWPRKFGLAFQMSALHAFPSMYYIFSSFINRNHTISSIYIFIMGNIFMVRNLFFGLTFNQFS